MALYEIRIKRFKKEKRDVMSYPFVSMLRLFKYFHTKLTSSYEENEFYSFDINDLNTRKEKGKRMMEMINGNNFHLGEFNYL